jgi:uridylate kinase
VKYRRVTLKLSGEALVGESAYGIDAAMLRRISEQVQRARDAGIEVTAVMGGGNILRGATAAQRGMDRATADYAGMLATVINALTLQDALEQLGLDVRTQTAITVQAVAEPYIRRRAIRHLEKGRIVLFAGGTGNPYFSTDTAAALRAVEIDADVLLMAKHGVDGVYDDDPRHNPHARKYATLSYMDAISRRLAVMDTSALALCMENNLPIVVFDLAAPDSIARAMLGEPLGTLVHQGESSYA